MPGQHAPLSASNSERWLNCPKTYVLSKDIPDEGSEFAAEGTRAHAYCEYLLRTRVTHEECETVRPDDLEMRDCCEDYLAFIQDKIYANRPYEIKVEQRVDFDNVVPGGFGTCDCLMVCDRKLIIVDFKYGRGVKVNSENNSQMQLYALGAMNAYEVLAADFETVEMNIYQPRIGNVSTWTQTPDQLKEFAEYAKTRALTALKGEEPAKAGPWCKFCRANGQCRERARKPIQAMREIMKICNNKENE